MFVNLHQIKIRTLLTFVVISNILCAQSVMGVQDTTQIRLLNEKTRICIDSNNDSALIYNQQSLALSQKIKITNFEAYSHKAFILIRKKKYDEALPVIQQAVKKTQQKKKKKKKRKKKKKKKKIYSIIIKKKKTQKTK